MNASANLDLIPHRPPFLFVDEIVQINDQRIMTRKSIDPGADFFRGHYPGNPVMPGVLLCECCFQAGALLIASKIGGYDRSRGIPVLARIADARFKRIVRPSETVDVEVTLDDELDGAYFMTARARVAGRLALRVTFVCMLAEGKEDQA